MERYKLTNSPDLIIDQENNRCIPRGHRLWEEYEEWLAEGNTPDDIMTKEQALQTKMHEISQLNRNTKQEDFVYEGNTFIADQEAIQATQNQCLLMDDMAPIPTPEGLWVLADNTTLYMTVADFKLFATAFYMRGSNNFGIKKYHEQQAYNIFVDPETTYQDILDYDCTTNWY
jgi:hypothetical protein